MTMINYIFLLNKILEYLSTLWHISLGMKDWAVRIFALKGGGGGGGGGGEGGGYLLQFTPSNIGHLTHFTYQNFADCVFCKRPDWPLSFAI